VTHDDQHPGASVAIGKTADPAKHRQAGMLHHVLGVGVVARQPAGQVVSGVEMRHHHAPETRSVIARADPIHTNILV
jgi:hypothetical protein